MKQEIQPAETAKDIQPAGNSCDYQMFIDRTTVQCMTTQEYQAYHDNQKAESDALAPFTIGYVLAIGVVLVVALAFILWPRKNEIEYHD